MIRKGWRVSRAFRVFLACLALWLPARIAGASFAPADAVVMIAGSAETTAAAQQRPDDSRVGRTARRMATNARRSRAAAPDWRIHPRNAPRTTNRALAPPLYFMHCALLR
jgi:hypothetical protein